MRFHPRLVPVDAADLAVILKTVTVDPQSEPAIQHRFCVNRRGYDSTSAGRQWLTSEPRLSMEDAVSDTDENYEQSLLRLRHSGNGAVLRMARRWRVKIKL